MFKKGDLVMENLKLRGLSGCVLLIVLLLMVPVSIMFDTFLLRETYRLLVLPAVPELPQIHITVFLSIVFLKIFLLYPVTKKLSKIPVRKSEQREAEESPEKALVKEIASEIVTKFAYLGLVWLFSIILF